jgi:hypothetical protein
VTDENVVQSLLDYMRSATARRSLAYGRDAHAHEGRLRCNDTRI